MIIAALVLENMPKLNYNNTILVRIENHISMLAPHQKEQRTGRLLIEAFEEIKTLKKQIADMEKAFLLTKTHE